MEVDTMTAEAHEASLSNTAGATSATTATDDNADLESITKEWSQLFEQFQASASSSKDGLSSSGNRSHDAVVARRGRATRGGQGAGSRAGTATSTSTSSSARSALLSSHAGSHNVQAHARGSPSRRKQGSSVASSSSSASTNTIEKGDALSKIRHKIVTTALPPDSVTLSSTGTSYRSVVWKLLLDIRTLPVAEYLTLISKGKSPSHDKIRNDTFRTLATDQGFKERVKEEKLIRLLDAFVWKYSHPHQQQQNEPSNTGIIKNTTITTTTKTINASQSSLEEEVYEFSYVQGMNVLAAPFLYTMKSEIEAFYCFSRFILFCCPLYVQPTLSGVHRGLQLLDRCLELLDEPLYRHLRSKNLCAEIYAFPSVMTLCACTPPLPEVLQLWDFLLAFGVHFNVLCIVAQLHIIRNDLLASTSPMKLLRNLPPLNARSIINVTVTLARDIPKDLYEELVKHPYHPIDSNYASPYN